MKKILIFTAVLVVLAGLFINDNSQAITIGFSPATQDVKLGSQALVDLFISGLGDFTAPSLSTFDLDVTFDPSKLGFSSAAYGDPVLGDQLDLFGFGSFTATTPGAGFVNLFELSFDLPSDLDTLQAGSFTLATLTFDTLAPGTSPLNLSSNSLGDALGDPLSAEIQNGSVSVVPEPTTFFLVGVGLAGAGYLKKRMRSV